MYESIIDRKVRWIMMVDKVQVKIYKVGSRHSINLPSSLVTDSAFPFKPNEDLTARIEAKRIIIEKKLKQL